MNRLFALLVVCVLAGAGDAAAGGSVPRMPSPRPAPIADFYAALRAVSEGDSLPGMPASVRDGAARVALLTDFLPDSFPLRTEANTVLIVHRRNPKYRAALDRLLWRRLDPAMMGVGASEEIADALAGVAAGLEPLCGVRADSVRLSMAGIIRSSYPDFLATIWPGHKHEIETWIRWFQGAAGGKRHTAVSELARTLRIPLPDTTKVRILVIFPPLPPDSPSIVERNGTASVVVSARSPRDHRGVAGVLRDYLLASAQIAAAGTESAPHLLTASLTGAPARLLRELPASLTAYAVAEELHRVYGWTDLDSIPSVEPYRASFEKNWNAYMSGGITLQTACAAIAADARGDTR